MSIVIRKARERLKKRLQEYFSKVDENTSISKNKDERWRLVEELEFDKRYLENAIRELEQCNKDWGILMGNLSESRLENEENLFNDLTKEDDTFNLLITPEKAKILLGVTEVRIKETLERTQEDNPNPINIESQLPLRTKLPQLSLPSFDGDPKKWIEI